MKIKNLFSGADGCAEREITDTLARFDGGRIERIVSLGQASPDGFWYDQSETEWVSVLAGSAKLEFEDTCITLSSGDFLTIPAHKRHRIKSSSSEPPCIWLCIFYTENK